MNGAFRLPLIPVLVAYALGIYLGHFDLRFPFQGLILFLLIPLGLWVLSMALKKVRWSSWSLLLFFFAFGNFSIYLYLHPQLSPSHISRFIGFDRVTVEGIVDRIPQRSMEGTQLLIRSERVIDLDRQLKAKGLLLLFLKEEGTPFHMGDRLRFVCRLYSPRGFRNPGGFSYERHLAFERIYVIGFLSIKNGWVKMGEGFGNPLILSIERWRDRIRRFIERESSSSCLGIFEALVLGEQGKISDEVKDYFIRTGTAHLLAISGDQFGIVAFLSFSLLIWILKRSEYLLLTISVKKWAAGMTIPCILLYAYIAGGGISVIRSMLMVITFLVSILVNRERHLLHTLALAAFLILIVSPPSLFDVSFQLSFLAVLSILYLVPRVLPWLKGEGRLVPPRTSWRQKTWNYVKLTLLVSAVAILGTTPFVTLHFNRVSPIGLITNLFIVPWVGFFTVPLALTASLFSFVSYPSAVFLIHVNGFITLLLLKVLSFFASFPFASFYVSTPTAFEIILFYLTLFTIVHLRRSARVRYLFIGICIALALDLSYWGVQAHFIKDLTLTFIDVGQGDSILVEFPRGKRMLIDGGGSYEDRFDTGKNIIAPLLWNEKISRIDHLVLTHPDPDHLKGLNFIASNFRIGQFWSTGFATGSDAYLQLDETVSRKKVERLILTERSAPLTIEGVTVSFLNPPELVELLRMNKNRSFTNNSSLVIKLQFRNISLLLVGDIEKEAESQMMQKGHPLKADLLKIPHHGSASSSSPLFLESVRPAYAILTVGERNIGHLPNPEVMRRYQRIGARVLRTDYHGAITVRTDGEKIEIKTFTKPE